MRTIIIGDVHGCYPELKELLKKVEFDPSADRLCFIGDLFDRGPQSYEVFELVRDLKSKLGDRLVIIRGNHEQMLIDRDYELWKINGGSHTRSSFYSHEDDVKKHIGWFTLNTTLYYRDPMENFQIVHAGLYTENPEDADPDTVIWDREPLEKGLYRGRMTFVGHTPVAYPVLSFRGDDGPHYVKIEYETDYDMKPSIGLICLDTGCVFGGSLTAAVIKDGQVRFHKVESHQKEKERESGQ